MLFTHHNGGSRRLPLVRRLLTASVAAAALLGTGLTVTAHADGQATGTTTRHLLPPKGYTTTPGGSGHAIKPQIVGGTPAAASAAPWMVQLLFAWDNDDNYYFTCGGTLVAPNKVLTAAHCVENEDGTALDWVHQGLVLGGTNKLVGGGGSNPAGTVATVSRVWHYSSFNPTTIDNDMAVLTLAQPLPYKTLTTAKNTDTALYAPNTQATVYGWGVTDSTPDSPNLADTLQQLTLPVNADATCKTELDSVLGPNSFVSGHMMCAGQPGTGDDTTGKSTCSGDSGGPLVAGGKILGIVSWGVSTQSQDCNVSGTYDVFTNVSTYGAAIQPRVDDTDISRDGKADLLVRTSAGATYAYGSTGSGFKSRVTAPYNVKADNVVVQADLDRDGYQDYVVRNTSTGNVYSVRRTATNATYKGTLIGTNWKTRRAILVPGDLTGDGLPDVISEDSSGRVYLYPGKGNGTIGGATLVATGWQQYNLVTAHGDFSNDGKADIYARDAKTGNIYLTPGTGKASAPFGTRLLIEKAWTGYNSIISTGDISGDGRADLLARTPAGTLYLFDGTGKTTSAAFGTAIKIGTGWQQYNLLG
ncbi:trypsin-like serine protease [Streptomyces sp. NBC_01190]|uniref:trypsin-like serine protease n=1 Tax=Streptomyces sp. NBC_01190 TaxID=2903767 RepID=UPI0038696F26|nr:trypsin-like serine protease [Streptomyces sp. NBC_01190]